LKFLIISWSQKKETERLSTSKRGGQKFDMWRFKLKMIKDVEVKKNIRSKSQKSLQFWKTWIMTWTQIGLWALLEII